MPDSNAPARKALIVTALPVEYTEVRRQLRGMKEQELPHGMVTEVGEFDSDAGRWTVWLIEAGMGNENAALETDRAVAAVQPAVVLFVGIAGGRKDVTNGDVVVASRVYGYEAGKDEDMFRPRPDAPEPTYRILQRARAVARAGTWRGRLGLGADERAPEVVIKPIAAGEKVVASRKAAVARLLDQHYSDTVAVDMEGHGFHRAMHARPGVEALVVRGISDRFDDKAAADAGGGQPIAARNATAFALEVLARLPARETASARTTMPGADADAFWTRLWEVASDLYPRGPEQNSVWELAGGEINRLRLSEPPKSVWYEAIELMRRGAGRELSPATLLAVMRKEYPQSVALAELSKSLPG